MAAQLVFGAGSSITFGTSGSGGAGTASFSKASLTNLAVGDLLVAWIHNQSSGTSDTMTSPAGWTRVGAPLGNISMSASRLTGMYYYPIKTAADLTNLAATPTWTFSTSVTRVACVAARATGIDLDNIEDAASTSFAANGGGSTYTIAGITTVSATTLLVGGTMRQNAANTGAPSVTNFLSSFQEYKTAAAGSTIANTGVALGYTYLTSAGPTGNIIASTDGTTSAMNGELVAFKALNGTPPATPVVRPTIVGTPTTFVTSNAVTSFTINTPARVRDGDALILVVSSQSSTATGDFAASGWSRISAPFSAANATADRLLALYAYPVPTATALKQSSFTFTSTDPTGGKVVAQLLTIRGAQLSSLTSAVSHYATTSGQSVSLDAGSPTVANNLLLAAYSAQFNPNVDYSVSSGPAGMVQQALQSDTVVASNAKAVLAVYKQDVDSGAIGIKTLNWNGAQTQSSGVSVAIRGAGSASTNYGKPTQYTSAVNTLSTADMFYTSATGVLATPLEIRPLPTGYKTVSQMLAASPFYVAHRGGSLNWPEMSLHAYTQSAFWGVGALELSLARTSDGVWFGLHDATLDRTSGTTGFTASAHTWAEVQAYLITASGITNSAQGAKPYARWEEIMAAYYGTHVIFIDPKAAVAYTTELLNMMDAMGNSPTTHFVGKYYGVSGNAANTTGWAKDLATRGYSRWGYFYQADVPNLATYQGRWDILGMDYNADSASWTAVKSYGKPVIGHIVPSSAAATTALGYGANGLMVSGVQSVINRSL